MDFLEHEVLDYLIRATDFVPFRLPSKCKRPESNAYVEYIFWRAEVF